MSLRLACGILSVWLLAIGSTHAVAQRKPLFQDGILTPGAVLKGVTQSRAASVGGLNGDVFGRGVNPFSITDNNGLGICSNSGPTTAAYRRICLGHDTNGDALLSVDAIGGATATPFRIRVDGAYLGFDSPDISTPLNKTANYTLEATDLGRGFTNAAATADVDLTLQASATLGRNCFYVVAAWQLRIVAPGTDTITTADGTSVAGGNAASDVPGSTMCVTRLSTGTWMATSLTGLWTVN